MNIQNTMNQLFPAGRVVDCGPALGGALEVHGLPRDTVPQNCEVLAWGQSRFGWGSSRQEVYLVRTADFVVFLRIGAAGPDSSDGEFVTSRAYAPVGDVRSQELQATARKSIAVFCTQPVGHWHH